jgi:hypothetical protein
MRSSRHLSALLAALLLVAACGGIAPSTARAACPDEQGAGLDAELEALLPDELNGVPPASVESGRFCSADALGSLIPAGIPELRFAGATWPDDARGVSLVLYRAPNLDLDRMADAFAEGAGVARRISNVTAIETTFAGSRAIRVNAVATDRALNVLLWSPRPPDLIGGVLASGLPEERIIAAATALEASAGR